MNRKLMKNQAKQVLKSGYWPLVAASLIGAFFNSGGSSLNLTRNFANDNNLVQVVAGSFLAATLILIFVGAPFVVGVRRYQILKTKGLNPEFNEVVYGFTHDYLNVVKVMFLRDLFTLLWTLLLIIPGIIKSFEYSMIPYLLAEESSLSYQDAFAKTKEMMNGYKFDFFVLGLSFILWYLLGVITVGIALVFYVIPYVDLTYVQFYLSRINAINDHTFDHINNQNLA